MNFDFSHVDISKGLTQIPAAIKVLLTTPAFIKKHQLWKGFFEHSWILLFSVIVATVFSYSLYSNIHDYFIPDSNEIEVDIPIDELEEGIKELDEAIENSPEEAKEDLEDAKEELIDKKEKIEGKHKSIFSGSLKFLLLIFLEVLIFHFSVKTNNILRNENKVINFQGFSNAQFRMIMVMGRKWVYGLIMYIFVSIICGFTGTGFLKSNIMFLIYSFYLGFAFLDNYLEQFKFTISDSVRCIQTHFGAATVFGIFASLVMNIPILGPLVVPFLCAIAATRYGHISQMETFQKTEKAVA